MTGWIVEARRVGCEFLLEGMSVSAELSQDFGRLLFPSGEQHRISDKLDVHTKRIDGYSWASENEFPKIVAIANKIGLLWIKIRINDEDRSEKWLQGECWLAIAVLIDEDETTVLNETLWEGLGSPFAWLPCINLFPTGWLQFPYQASCKRITLWTLFFGVELRHSR